MPLCGSKTSFAGEDGKESARVRKGIPAGLPFFPTVETVCTARAKRLPEAGWVFFLRGGRPVFVFLKGRNGWLKMAGCRLVHALLRRNGEDVWQCVFYLKPENGLLLHRCAFRPEKRRFQKPSFVRLTKCHRTDRSRNESGWKIIVNRRNRPTWQTCKTSSQTSPCWDILSETPIFVCFKGKLYLSAFIDRKKTWTNNLYRL